MKGTKFTEHQIVKALKEEENGRSAIDLRQEFGINKQPPQHARMSQGFGDGHRLKIVGGVVVLFE